MRKQLSFVFVAAVVSVGALGQLVAARAQNSSPQTSSGQTTPRQTAPASPTQRPTTPRTYGLDLSDYGIRIEPEPRLIVMMAALDAAGLNLTPAGTQPSAFREMVRRDVAALDPNLRARLQSFYRLNKLPDTATPAEQAARYVSLAYALGAPPAFEAPARTDDLPKGILEVLDFAPLVREFFRQSAIDEHLPEYVRASREEGNQWRVGVAATARAVLSYLHTQPQTTYIERIPTSVNAQAAKPKKNEPERKIFTTRERERRFNIVPDLLGAPGAINFRVIGDDYYVIVPSGTDPASSELRRAYLQFVVDPLVLRFNREVAARRADLRTLLDEQRERLKSDLTPDVFLAVARSLVAAADARMLEQARTTALTRDTSERLQAAKSEAERAAIVKQSQETRASVEDATTAQLADAYERGALLSFYFAEQLRGLENSGFDIASFFPDMMASLDVARERRRPTEYVEGRRRFNEARQRAQQARAAANAANAEAAPDTAASAQRTAMLKNLESVNELLRQKNHVEAERRLRALAQQFPGEPRIFFALGQAASLSAEDAFDTNLQAERLRSALGLYRMAVERASTDSDRALISRAHAASGRILAFLERNDEAVKEFDAAIQLGEIEGGAYRDALAEKQKLQPQK